MAIAQSNLSMILSVLWNSKEQEKGVFMVANFQENQNHFIRKEIENASNLANIASVLNDCIFSIKILLESSHGLKYQILVATGIFD